MKPFPDYYCSRPPPGFIQGDTPLSSGRHAWRVRVDGFDERVGEIFIGIHRPWRPEEIKEGSAWENLHFDWTFTGFEGWTLWRFKAGDPDRPNRIKLFSKMRSGDMYDCVLDLEKREFTVFSLRDKKSASWSDLAEVPEGYVPHFILYHDGDAVTVEIIEPEEAGVLVDCCLF